MKKDKPQKRPLHEILDYDIKFLTKHVLTKEELILMADLYRGFVDPSYKQTQVCPTCPGIFTYIKDRIILVYNKERTKI